MNKKEAPGLGLPLEVHPGIKLCRWVCLIAGVFHGAEKLKRVKIFDAPLREQERIRDELRREYIAKEKAIASRAELAALALIFLDDPAALVDYDTIEESNETYGSTSQHEKERARLTRIVKLAEAEIEALNETNSYLQSPTSR